MDSRHVAVVTDITTAEKKKSLTLRIKTAEHVGVAIKALVNSPDAPCWRLKGVKKKVSKGFFKALGIIVI